MPKPDTQTQLPDDAVRLFTTELLRILDKKPNLTPPALAAECGARVAEVQFALMSDDRFVTISPRWAHPMDKQWRVVDV